MSRKSDARRQVDKQLSFVLYGAANQIMRMHRPFLEPLGLTFPQYLVIPVHLIQELAKADPEALSNIEISPSGLALHWPSLDADVYVPGLMKGMFGTKRWMAAQLGAAGGRATTAAKAAAARQNGAKGGRPRKQA